MDEAKLVTIISTWRIWIYSFGYDFDDDWRAKADTYHEPYFTFISTKTFPIFISSYPTLVCIWILSIGKVKKINESAELETAPYATNWDRTVLLGNKNPCAAVETKPWIISLAHNE